MLSRLTQGVTSVLNELSGEEHRDDDDDDPQDGLVPRVLSGPGTPSDVSSPSEEIMDQLAQTEQLVVQLKELIREKDGQLARSEKLLKEEKEQGEAKFTKLKLQAKAKMAALNKQIADLKGHEGLNTSQSSESSFTLPSGLEEELHKLKEKLSQEESSNQTLQKQLKMAEQRIKEKEEEHSEQVRVLQAVVKDKDVRFQEQIQKHEDELLQVNSQTSNNIELQQALRDSQRRIEELEESLRSRSEVLEMLQQELNSADQQKQILTAQFRQMEQELAEAHKLREQEKQQSAMHAEEHVQALKSNLEALEKAKELAIRALEAELSQKTSELDQVKASLDESINKGKEEDAELEAELARLRTKLEASERQTEEVTKKLEVEVESRVAELHQLQEKLDAVERERQEASQSEKEELIHLQTELASLRERLDAGKEEQEAGARAKQVLEKLWKGLHSLSSEGSEVQLDVPEDPAQVLCVLEARLDNLRAEHQEREGRMSQISVTIETLQGQLDKSTADGHEAVARIQQLEQQLAKCQVTDEPLGNQETDLSVRDLDKAEAEGADRHNSEKLLALEQQLVEKEKELDALREQLAFIELQNLQSNSQEGNSQNTENIALDSSVVLPGLEDVAEEDTTLIAVDSETSAMSTSIVSSTADNESGPEMTGPQPESPIELKGASSDEMVTSTDSEVAHSSWTLLEAINHDAGQEWSQQFQDLNALHLSTQSWEETSEEQVTSTCSMVKVESSSMVIQETVQIQIQQQEASVLNPDSSPSQAFAQILAEELEKKYSELPNELQQIKHSAAESQSKVHLLEEELKSLTILKDDAEARALRYEQDLIEAQAKIHKEAEQKASEKDTEKKVLEELLESLQKEAYSKDQKIQTLQADLDEIQRNLTEKEAEAQALVTQLEDKEIVSSELKEKVIAMETSIQQFSDEAERAKADLIGKTSKLDDLQQYLSLKEQEMMELNDNMTAKLLQAGEEKFVITSEVKMLKEQMMELKKTWDDQQTVKADKTAEESEDLVGLHKENENLLAQIATMKTEGEQVKRKLQAALVQRKDLMQKVAAFEKEAEGYKEKVCLEGDVVSKEIRQEQELQKLKEQLQKVRQILQSKEEALNVLEEKMLVQDQALSEANVEIQHLIEKAESSGSEQMMQQVQEDNIKLQTQVTDMESDIDALQKKLQEAVDSRKDTLRKAKEKDRHHREQLRQQKEEYSGLLERFEARDEEKLKLIERVTVLERLVESRKPADQGKLVDVEEVSEAATENVEKPGSGDWAQDDWVDFTTPDQQGSPAEQPPQATSGNHESLINSLQDKFKSEEAARMALEMQLQESQVSLSLKETELLELRKDLEILRVKEKQIDALSEELDALRRKCEQAEAHAEMLKVEVEEAAVVVRTTISDAESPVVALQAEVNEFKQFLKSKNDEIIDLSQQLSEQSFLLQKIQETVLEKDQVIASLQEDLKAEQMRSQKLEAEMPQKQEDEKDNSAKFQQLQRKFQAALVSRKEALKENQALKEELNSAEKLRSELLAKIADIEGNLSNLTTDKDKLIEEVDRTLLENQSLGATCESLKLAMDGLLNEKEMYKRQVDSSREEAKEASRRWEEKLQGMKEEYETLLKSYENVSDEAERVRRVLEAARQDRQDSAAKARAHEAAKLEAEKVAEEAQKEVDTVKEKMRKFAKTKHQKIMELEEENEKLREQVEKKGRKDQDTSLEQELEKVKDELEALRANFDSLEAERHSLEQETEKLKQQLAQDREKKNSGIMDCEEVEEHLRPVLTENQEDLAVCSISMESNLLAQPGGSVGSEFQEEASEVENKAAEQLKKKEAALEIAEGKLKELHAALEDEKRTRVEQVSSLTAELSSLRQNLQESVTREAKLKKECSDRETQLQVTHTRLEDTMGTRVDQESVLNSELSSLKQHLQESAEREQRLKEECSKKDSQLQELRTSLEVEKDDLEERLMNQLAQVNGTIAGYQQETADSRDRLADLQRELEKMQNERAELEAMLAGETDRAARLEEDKRQAQRERAEAEAEAGKQRELEQKLKSAQRVKEGSQSRARQLEELLREKQLEVRQMQKDCIQYQERISVLDRETKAIRLGRDEVSNELEVACQEMAKIKEERTRLESELLMYKGKLDVAQGEVSQALAEKVASEQLLHRREAELKSEAEQTLDEVRYRLGAELKQMELRLEQAYKDKEQEEEATVVAKNIADAAQKYAQETQARLDESLARLAAFSRSMSSLQDDRDRVLDEAKQWESRFHSALQGKEAELREAESRAKDLSEQLQKEVTQKEQLQSSLERLQKAEEQWQLELSEAKKKHKESLTALERERVDLQQKLTHTESSLAQAQSQLTSLEAEAEGLHHRNKAVEEAVEKLQSEANQARVELKERETEERRLCLNLEQLETDLRSSKTLTDTLQAELAEKQKREVELLGEKEHAVSQAVEEARKEADSRAEEAEKQLEERRAVIRDLEERLHKAEMDASQSKARLDSFTKAMGSLQDDRDRVLSQYKQLEERHLQVMMEKDGLIQEAATENNSLKEELRALLAQRDDLHAENAKLDAQLHGYRDELNQVLTMKDSQHKKLLSVQFERVSALEKEREEFQAKIEFLEKEALVKSGTALEHEVLSQSGQVLHDAPGAELEKLREQLQGARKMISTLEETLASEREVYTAHSKELKDLRWEGGILRTEAETAEERVAELARDLMEMEQKLLAEKEAAAQLQAQNQAFGQAMASLQNSRDEAMSEVKELRFRMEQSDQTGQSSVPPSSTTGEVWSLKNALSALQNDRERMLEQLQIQRTELEKLGSGELGKLTKILEKERKKTGAVEKRMSELLQERDTQMERDRQELEILRLERSDLQDQAESFRKQTLTTLSERDQQIRQLGAMLEEARSSEPKVLREHSHRQGRIAEDSAPGGPHGHSEDYKAECVLLQKRLDEEMELRISVQEQLSAAQDHLKRYKQEDWHSGPRDVHSETAVLIEPPEGAVTRSRSGGPGLGRMLRGAFCSRQRTPLLVLLYLLTIHAVLLLCLGGYL